MKISQRIGKPEMWGCFVKKLEAFSVLAADTDARIEVGVGGGRRMHLFLLHVSIFKHSKPHAPFSQ